MIFKYIIAFALVLSLAHGQNKIQLLGTIRDFANKDSDLRQAHPDFNAFKTSLVTGMVATTLGADGKPVLVNTQRAVTSKDTFNQWYNDVADVNINIPYTLELTETGVDTGIYMYDNQNFLPIDGQGYGNDLPYNRDHNWGFTFEIHTVFTYKTGQTFNFMGDDDIWVFINNQLVIDLGGTHGSLPMGVDLDTLGLTEGKDYPLDIFYAERHATGSSLAIRTSIKLKPICIAPKVYNPGKNICDDCVLPQVYLDSIKDCGPCDAPQVYNEATFTCADCVVPQVYLASTKACGSCNAPRLYNSQTFTCESCPAASARNFNGICIPDCPKNLQGTQDSLPICKFPCKSTQIYNVVTEMCICSCKAPYTKVPVNGYQTCDLIDAT